MRHRFLGLLLLLLAPIATSAPPASKAPEKSVHVPLALSEFGGVKLGAELGQGWKLESLTADAVGIRFGVRDRAGHTLHLVASTTPGPASPFDLGQVRIYFERTDVPSDAIAVPARALAQALVSAAGSEAALRKLVTDQSARAARADTKPERTAAQARPPEVAPGKKIDLSAFAGAWRVVSKVEGGRDETGRCERVLKPDSSLLEESCRLDTPGPGHRMLGTWGVDRDGKLWLFWTDPDGGAPCFGSSGAAALEGPFGLRLSCSDGSSASIRISRTAGERGTVVREWTLSQKDGRKAFVTRETRE